MRVFGWFRSDFTQPYEQPIRLEKGSARLLVLLEEYDCFGTDIPKGYRFDGASVPRIFWAVLSPFTEGIRAALLHDYRHTHTIKQGKMTRKESDQEFWRNLRACGLSVVRASMAYFGVRVYANVRWKYIRQLEGRVRHGED